MDRSARIYRIHQLLRERRRPVPFNDFLRALEVSPATLKRDFQFLRDQLQAPLEYDGAANGYHYRDDGTFELPGLWLNHSELYALLATEQLLESVQPGFLSGYVGPLRQRIRRILGEAGRDAEAVGERIRIDRIGSRATPGESFGRVAEATLARRRLRFHYHGRARDTGGEREVEPQQLFHYRGNWYLLARCRARDELRVFSVDRIAEPEVLEAPARDEASEAIDRFLRASFGIFTGAAQEWAVLRFSPHAARWVADEQWHPDQIGHYLPDGGWELQVPFADPTELIQEVLRHGPEVEVVAPEGLRGRVVERLRGALGVYESDSGNG